MSSISVAPRPDRITHIPSKAALAAGWIAYAWLAVIVAGLTGVWLLIVALFG